MDDTCSRCGAMTAPDLSFCPECGSEIKGCAFSFAEIPRNDGPHFCSQCGGAVTPETATCPHCGSKVVDVLLGAHELPPPPPEELHAEKRPRPRREARSRRFDWRWFFASAGIIVLVTAASMLAMGIIAAILDPIGDGAAALLLILFSAGGVFSGAYIAAARSAGRTVIEPALAAAGLTVLFTLLFGGDLLTSAIAAFVPFLAALAGAWSGERRQSRRRR